ncbi:hypothetical protein GEMRC1_000597 [Eukaryota sp. GEM-RC1]
MSLSINDLSSTASSSNSFIDDANNLLSKLDSALRLSSSSLDADESALELSTKLRGELKARLDVLVMRISESNRIMSEKLSEEQKFRSILEDRITAIESKLSTSDVDRLEHKVHELSTWKADATNAIKTSADGISRLATSLKDILKSSQQSNTLSEQLSSTVETVKCLSNEHAKLNDDFVALHSYLKQREENQTEYIDSLLEDTSSRFSAMLNGLKESVVALESNLAENSHHVEEISSTLVKVTSDFNTISEKLSIVEDVSLQARTQSTEAVRALTNLSVSIQTVTEDCRDGLIGDKDVEVFLKSINDL